ncbi:hypothetical protein ABVK25_000679 [Lepraria finkii]|uniref:Uncharacterized protein n=1 Tax=Lepraria finkii TaxID=1340010 RepID=A0ABR4BQV3_9LECA
MLADVRCLLYLYACCMKTRANPPNVCRSSSSSVFLSSWMAGSLEYLLDQGREGTTVSFSKSAAPLNIQIHLLRAMKGSYFQEKKGDVVIIFAICCSFSTCSDTLIGSLGEPTISTNEGADAQLFSESTTLLPAQTHHLQPF